MLTAHKATQSCNVRATRTWPTSMLTCLRTVQRLPDSVLGFFAAFPLQLSTQ